MTASQDPIVKQAEGDQPEVRYHEGAVTWTAELTVPPGTPPGEYALAGIVGYQTCTDTACDRPLAARFTAKVTVGEAAGGHPRPLVFADARYAEAAHWLPPVRKGARQPPPAAGSDGGGPDAARPSGRFSAAIGTNGQAGCLWSWSMPFWAGWS